MGSQRTSSGIQRGDLAATGTSGPRQPARSHPGWPGASRSPRRGCPASPDRRWRSTAGGRHRTGVPSIAPERLRFNLTAVSACPMTSCRSRAILRRSCSWAATRARIDRVPGMTGRQREDDAGSAGRLRRSAPRADGQGSTAAPVRLLSASAEWRERRCHRVVPPLRADGNRTDTIGSRALDPCRRPTRRRRLGTRDPNLQPGSTTLWMNGLTVCVGPEHCSSAGSKTYSRPPFVLLGDNHTDIHQSRSSPPDGQVVVHVRR